MDQLTSDSFPQLSSNTSPTFQSRPKSQLKSSFTPAAKSRYWPQNNLSIETKSKDDKSHQNSLYISKTTKHQDIRQSSNLKSVTNASIRHSESILRTMTAGSDTSQMGFSASGSKRQTKNSQNLRKIVLGSPDTAVSYSFQASAVSLPQTHLLESFQSREVPRIAKFESLASSNPHYHKFNHSIYILDRSDTEKLSLSKELFYYPDQIEAVENIKRGGSKEPEVHHLLTKIIKENKREELEIPNGRTFFLKFYTFGKICPLAVEIEGGAGQYEVYVSITKDKPGPQQHDAVFKESHFELDFSECDDVKCIFFGIKANQAMRIAILCCFTFRNRIEKKVDPLLPLLTSAQTFKRNPKNKRNVYEFFSKDASRDEASEFEATITQIKKEKRQKMLQLSKGRNWLNQNKEIAHDYHKIRELQHTASSQKRDFRIQQNRETRDILQVETHEKLKQKIFLNSVKGFLTKFGEEEKLNQIRDEKIRKRVQLNWFGILCLFRLASSILEKKRAVFAINILTRIKDGNAVRIQKKVRQHFDKPLIVKEMGTNTLSESKEPEIRTQVTLHEFFNFLALSSKEVKHHRAETLIVNFSEDLLVPHNLKLAIDQYIEKVKIVQFKWRQKIALLNAKLQVFFKSWNKFCQLLQDEDSKAKKKKWAHILPMVREIHVIKHAKNFVRNRMREVVKDAMAQALLQKKKQNEAKTLPTNLELEDPNNSPPAGRSLERSGTRNSLMGVGSPKSPSAKPDLKKIGKKKTEKFQNPTTLSLVKEEDRPKNERKTLTAIPTYDELQTILKKIADEIKDDPHHF